MCVHVSVSRERERKREREREREREGERERERGREEGLGGTLALPLVVDNNSVNHVALSVFPSVCMQLVLVIIP